MFELFEKGGLVMGIIFALSIYVTAVVLFKIYQFWKLKVLGTKAVEMTFAYLEKRGPKDALAYARSVSSPVGRVMAFALVTISDKNQSREQAEEEIRRVGAAELRSLETHLKGLEMSASIAPLLGLLGTVIGMVAAFSTLEAAGSRVDPSLLAGGIWTALLTTVAGLSVAIPALAADYIFDGIVERARGTMQDAAGRIISLHGKLPSFAEASAPVEHAAPVEQKEPAPAA